MRRLTLLLLAALLAPQALAQEGAGIYIFDVTDLLMRRPDFPAPRLGLESLDEVPDLQLQEEEENPAWTRDELIETIRSLFSEEEQEERSIQIHKGLLIIACTPKERKKIANNLGTLDRRLATYRVDAELKVLTPQAIESLGFTADSGSVRVLDRHPTEAMLDKLKEQDEGVTLCAQNSADDNEKPMEIKQPGLKLEFKARRHAGGLATKLSWKATVGNVTRKGKTVLKPGQLLAIRGFPSNGLNGPEEAVLLVRCQRQGSEKKAKD